MVTLRAFEALFAGFAVIALINLAASLLLKKLAPDWTEATGMLSAGFVFANLGSSFLAAAAGGYSAAWIGEGNPLPYLVMLGIVVVVVAGLSALQQRGKRPIVYLLASIAIAPLGVLAGGLVQLRVSGVLQ